MGVKDCHIGNEKVCEGMHSGVPLASFPGTADKSEHFGNTLLFQDLHAWCTCM